MPRGTKKNANQHNNRHENGVVAPGKRITKQKSNGHLNGSPDGRSRANTPPLATAPSAHPTSRAGDNIIDTSSSTVKEALSNGSRHDDRGKGLAEIISGEIEVLENGKVYQGKLAVEHNHRRIDVSAMKPRTVYDNSAVHLALTVLKACPFRDTLAILTFLLSLPPTFLTLTNAVFTILTFVPPQGNFSGFPSLSDIFQGYSSPVSFSTMIIIDIIGIAIWLPLFKPIQALILDWAQAMVATTLGGGYASRPGGSDSTLLCISIVSATHLSRYKRLQLRILHRTWLGRWTPLLDALNRTPPAPPDPGVTGRPLLRNVRTLIALHIVMQGLGRLIRKWLIQYRDNTNVGLTFSPLDPEAIAGSHVSLETIGGADQVYNPPNTPLELKSKGSLQSLRDGRDKHTTGKKKRRQGQFVRSQQPLWAAFAATKATIMREYQQSQATHVAMGSNATDAENLGSAPFVLADGRIWITMVRPSNFFFETSFFSPPKNTPLSEGNGDDWVDGNGINRANPFYVRINGADWTSTKMHPVAQDDEAPERGQQWTGEVYGLSPAYSYRCSFVRCEDDVVIHSEVVVTPSSPIIEQGKLISRVRLYLTRLTFLASSALVAPPHQTLHPSSPASPLTTLKSSIAASENTLNDVSSQQRRIRKDGKAASAALRKDLDLLNDRMNKVGNNDRGLLNRQLQQSQHMRQADDAINLISDELESYAKLPLDEPQDWQQQKSIWENGRSVQAKIREDLLHFKQINHRDHAALQTEALTTTQKRERLQHRAAKLSDQLNRLQSSAMAGTSGKERHFSEYNAKNSQRHQMEAHLQEQLSNLVRGFHELQYRGRNTWQQIQALEQAYEQQAIMASQSPLSDSRPITPEGDLPGIHPASTNSTGFRFPSFSTPESLASLPNGHGVHSGFRNEGSRARSTSLLSGNSVYTDFDDDIAPPMPPLMNRGVGSLSGMGMGRKGSASGSGSGSSGSGGQSPRLRKGVVGDRGSPLVG